ncbi:substrate-binding periplasmic protein [Epibacterium ulvae]|uniref:substrate-binding periplasmic protein n=1 Tax=Epibacterium ulvae TaxID=1156985 RepID=UPI0024935C3D|nr:transporter substrate-binding domain-containing protein [Epibacterium ulvae]
MIGFNRFIATCSTALLLGTSAIAAEYKITSLNWEPYVGENLSEGGVLVDVLRQALAQAGDTLSVDYLPWARAVSKAKGDQAISGYYPAWPSDIAEGFFASSIVYKSPLGFVQRTDSPITWNALEDLKGKSIVVVKSYGYPPEFEALMESGDVTIHGTSDDAMVVKMVAGGRADIGVVDPFVMANSLATDASMTGLSDKVEYNTRHLVEYPLVLALRDTAENRAMAAKLEESLANMPIEQIVSDALN